MRIEERGDDAPGPAGGAAPPPSASARREPGKPVALADFVGFLQRNGMLPIALRYTHEQQERLQKCAFIAQVAFGLGLGYNYHLHAYGTFSTILAIDFSEIARGEAPAGAARVPPSFDAKGFVSLVSGRAIDWLSVASAVIHETHYPHVRGSHRSRMARVTAPYGRLLVWRVTAALAKSMPGYRRVLPLW